MYDYDKYGAPFYTPSPRLYAGKIPGYTYTGHGHYENNNPCGTDIYTYIGPDGRRHYGRTL